MASNTFNDNGRDNPPHNGDANTGGGPPNGDFTMESTPLPSTAPPPTPTTQSRKRAASPQLSPAKYIRMIASSERSELEAISQLLSDPSPAAARSWAHTAGALLDSLHTGITNICRQYMGEGVDDGTEGSRTWDETIRSVSHRMKTIVDDSLYPNTQSIFDDPMITNHTPTGLSSSIHAPGNAAHRPSPPNAADTAVLDMLKEMRSEMRSIRGEVSSLRNRISAIEQPGQKAPATKPTQAQSSSYAAATATVLQSTHKSTTPPPSNPPLPSKKANSPKKPDAPKLPVEVVVALGENKLLPEARHGPEAIVEEINREFHRMPTLADLTVLGAQWTVTGNCKLSFLPGTNAKKVCAPAHLDVIRKAASNGRNVTIEPNAKWSKFAVNGVLVRDADGHVFSEETLDEALRLNPFFADPKVRIMQKPRFTKKDEEITSFRLSISFAILDADGSLGKQLMKQPLFMFGSPVTICKWHDKPQLTQCKQCWALGHTTSSCHEKEMCHECGSKSHHTTTEHRKKCQLCLGTDASIPCVHFRCVNCKAGHVADSHDCPACRKYRVLVAEPTRLQASMDTA